MEALGELLSIQSSFELEHCLLPGLFSMISQQSAIVQGPGLLLQRNSTYDISLLQRGQSLSSMRPSNVQVERFREFQGVFSPFFFVSFIITHQKTTTDKTKKKILP